MAGLCPGHPDCYGTALSHIAATLYLEIEVAGTSPATRFYALIQNDREPL
jgi:hypothetical protein